MTEAQDKPLETMGDSIRQAAEIRVRYLLWLAGKLRTSDDPVYRSAAAEALEQVAS